MAHAGYSKWFLKPFILFNICLTPQPRMDLVVLVVRGKQEVEVHVADGGERYYLEDGAVPVEALYVGERFGTGTSGDGIVTRAGDGESEMPPPRQEDEGMLLREMWVAVKEPVRVVYKGDGIHYYPRDSKGVEEEGMRIGEHEGTGIVALDAEIGEFTGPGWGANAAQQSYGATQQWEDEEDSDKENVDPCKLCWETRPADLPYDKGHGQVCICRIIT